MHHPYRILFSSAIAATLLLPASAQSVNPVTAGQSQSEVQSALVQSNAGGNTRIQILHASDLEGGVEAVSDAPNFAAIVEALENDASGQGVSSLLLSAGDNYIPGPFFSAAGDFSMRQVFRDTLANPDAREGIGRADVSIMNLIGVDASAIGNHEFDAGSDTFESIIGTDIRDSDSDGVLDQPRWLGAQFPYLSSNLDFSADGSLGGLFTASLLPNTAFQSTLADLNAAAAAPKLASATIVQRGGISIGVVGATTPLLASISSPGNTAVKNPGAGSNDMAALASILQPVIDSLTNQGIDKVILVTHLQQIALEQQLVPLLSGVDVVIAGGSDTLLADGDDRLRSGDTAQGAYPLQATNMDGQPTLIVSTDGQYSYVGRLVVDFDSNGVVIPTSVVEAESGVFATDEQGVSDLWGNLADPFLPGTKGAAVTALTSAVRQIVIAKDGNVFGSSDVFLEGRRTAVRTEETNLGTLTAIANLAMARQVDPWVRASLKNGGGIRGPIGSIDGLTGELLPTQANPESGKLEGEISQLDIENTLRFNNGLSLVTLTRSQLKQVLEHAVAETQPGSTPGRFAQVGGISFSFDPTRPVGERVLTAGFTEPGLGFPIFVYDGHVIGWLPVRIVTLNFLADGGDGYPYPDFEAATPWLYNRVDLANLDLADGFATFAPAGTEQDAMAEYLAINHSTAPFQKADTPVAEDQFIQNLTERLDYVLFTVWFNLRF